METQNLRHALQPRLPPGSGEAPTSLLSRHADLHWRRLHGFCRDFGLDVSGIADGSPTAIKALAALTGVDAGALEDEAFRKVGVKRWDHKGETLTAGMLSRSTKRFCPLCLAGDVNAAAGDRHAAHHAYGRSLWQLDPVRSCLKHGVMLETATVTQDPWAIHDFAGAVVPLLGDLAALEARARPVEPSPMEAYLAGRLEGSTGPAFLDRLAWHAVADLCQAIGAVETFGRDASLLMRNAHEWRATGVAGYDIASGGEETIAAFLGDLDRSYEGARFATDGPQARYGNFFKWLAGTLEEPDFDPLREIVTRHVVETTPVGPGDRIFGTPVRERKVHSIRSASLAYEVHPKRLRKALEAKGVIGGIAGIVVDERVTFEASAENLAIIAMVADALSLTEAETYLNAGRVHAKLLSDAGLIKPFVEVSKASSAEKNFAKRDLDAFLARLLGGAAEVASAPSNALTIPAAAKRANCGAVEIVRLILESKLAWVGALAGEKGYLSVVVDLAEVKRHVHGPRRQGLTARDVEKRLRTQTKTVAALIEHGMLPTSTILNPVNRCPTKVVEEADVKGFEETFVSLNRLAEERGTHFRTLAKDLERAAVRPALTRDVFHATFYRRAEVQAV